MHFDNTIHHGEALRWLQTLPDACADALITDPPYSSGGASAAARKETPSRKYMKTGQAKIWVDFAGDNNDQRSQLQWMLLWLEECRRILRDGAPVCVFTDWRQLPLTTDALQCSGFIWRGVMVWDKTEGARPQPGRPRAQAEYIVWGSKGRLPLSRNAPIIPGVIREANRRSDKHHMTGKPTALMRQLVQICARNEHGTGLILDPFAGSGSTLVAAKQEGFQYAGCEMVEHYAKIARARLAEVDVAQVAQQRQATEEPA